MQSCKGSEFLDAGTLSRSRTSSISSDSQLPRINLMSPPSVRPPPGFISSSAASEIITSDQEFNAADFVAEDEETGAGANALVTPAALSLLNGFLDNLLFNILGASKSTQLTSIRPAVADVLKPRLAGEVVATADEELSEYMGGAENEQAEFRGGQQPAGDFDLVRSWKLTRLRCMVYTRLGDMEEEDEDEFIAQERLRESDGAPRRFTSHVDNITPAAAIFLTSIIEHIGERALVIAGETARSRLSAKLNNGENASTDLEEERKRIDRLVVEDLDMEKLALNATLGRLWRTWRKRRRGSTISQSLHRPESRESFRRRGYSLANSRKSSIATIEEPVTPQEALPEEEEDETLAPVDPATVPLPMSDCDVQEIEIPVDPATVPLPMSDCDVQEIEIPVDPATVPLPMSDYDVLEIEIPGFSPELEGEVQTMEAVVAHKVRPRSLMVFSLPSLTPRSPGSSKSSPVSASAVEKSLRHGRSRSLPNAAASPPREVQADPTTTEQPSPSSEEKKQLETMYEDDESAEFVDAAEPAPGVAITTSHDESPEPGVELPDQSRMPIVHEEEEEQGPPVSLTAASLRSSDHDDDPETDQSNSARVSISSTNDQQTNDPEVIEGQGMCEKPKPASTIQRPKRKSIKDATQLNAKPIIAETSEADTQSVVEAPPSTQGAEPTLAPSATTIEAIESSNDDDALDDDALDGDQDKSVVPSSPAIEPVNDDALSENPQEPPVSPETPRPSSGDSERSQQSRRDKPSPLLVTSSNRSSPGLERAAVQRVSIRPSTSVSSPAQPKSRRSESFSSARDKRPVTAGSTTSQVSSKLKGLMGRPQVESPTLRLRSSSETSRASGSADSVDNDTKDLDKLINSDETIHFTLTPRSVREMTFPDVPRPIPRSDTTDTTDLAEFLKNTGPPGEGAHRPRTSVSSKATGEGTSIGRAKSVESPKHIPLSSWKPLPPKPSGAGQAREARARDSTLEFADFIKSSGPTNAPHRQSVAAAETRPARPPSSFSSRSNRPRLQARPAETSGSQTSDLIDFIREGPPQAGAHRIPRTVAPFRNTIDSDDLKLDSVHNEKGQTTRSSLASTQDGSTPNKSLTSLGSRTGLLDSANRLNGQAKATSSASAAVQDGDHPARKQRRVLDPYAIDDDEDDDMLEELINPKPKPQREEESLLDFLRSAPPPEFEQHPQPLDVNVAPLSSSNGFASSASGMKARLLRGYADKAPAPKLSVSSLRSQNNTRSPSNYSAKVGMERNPGTLPSTSHRQTDTGALADFLRNTGPPEPPASTASSSSMNPKMKEGSFVRFFSRRKKVEV